MSQVTIVCPHCGLSKNLPAGKVPDVRIRVNCPRCKGSFDFTKPADAGARSTEPPDLFEDSADDGNVNPRSAARSSGKPSPHLFSGNNGELTGIGDLFSESWEIFRQRFGTLFSLYLLTMVLFLLPFAIFAGAGYLLAQSFPASRDVFIALGVTIGSVVGFLGMFLGLGAFIAAITDESLAIRESLAKGKLKLFSFIWVCLLAGFIVTGGFLLLVIPGIIFSIWFFFAQFIVMDEDTRGMDALLKSKEYVRGYWFGVFVRFLLIWLVSSAVGMVPVAGPALSLLAIPYVMIYYCLIYRDLQRIKDGNMMFSCGTGDKAKWVAAGIAGYIAVPAIILSLFGASLTSSYFMLRSIMENKGRTVIIPPDGGGESFEIPLPLPPAEQDMGQPTEGGPA